MRPDIILASGSPRRRELLERLGWKFKIEAATVEETHADGEKPEDMVCRLAESKAANVYSRHTSCWVIGADTVVVADGSVLGKPENENDAVRMIMLLQGKKHSVITGVALFAPDGGKLVYVEKTDVTFHKMTDTEAIAYVAAGESLDKAGAYAIQGHGSLLVEKIDGCYFNVVGLPLALLSKMFSELGWSLSEQWRV